MSPALWERYSHAIDASPWARGNPGSVLDHSILPPFRASEDDGYIDEYLEERAAGRMDGPYTEEEMRRMCGGHFAACPVHVVTQLDEAGKLKRRIVRNMSFEGREGYSVNDLLDSDDYPTEWGSAPMVAEIVSTAVLSAVCGLRLAIMGSRCTYAHG